jgi:hypothetical protein
MEKRSFTRRPSFDDIQKNLNLSLFAFGLYIHYFEQDCTSWVELALIANTIA